MGSTDKFPKDSFEGAYIENRYRLNKYLGEGGFGAVFLASQEVLGHKIRQVAIKITKTTEITASQAGDILKEAIILARVLDEIQDNEAKRYLVRIYDMGVLEQRMRRGFIVMEFVPGMSLRTKMEHFKRMPIDMCLRYTQQMCTSLAALHNLEEPVIHRDLKPDNVQLTMNDEVRILDFGLAARVERAFGYVEGAAGTEGYMSPETSIRQESSCASDVYSIGVMMYEMLTGNHPFAHLLPPPRYNEEQRREWIYREKERNVPKPPSALNNTVGNLDAVIMRCLEFKDYERYQNAAELLRDISNPTDTVSKPEREQLLEKGLQHEAYKRWAAAEKCYRSALSILPWLNDKVQFDLHHHLALVCIEQKKFPDAIGQIRQAEDLNEKKLFMTTKKQRAEFYGSIANACDRAQNEPMALKYRNLEKKERG